jgi:hypothetical protein
MNQSFIDGLVVLHRRLHLTGRPVAPSATSSRLAASRSSDFCLDAREMTPSDAYQTNISATAAGSL